MKLFVITFAILIAFSERVTPELYILHPDSSIDILMVNAWASQNAAQKLQADFDKASADANGLVTKILGGTMLSKFYVHRNHTDDLLDLYNYVFEQLVDLPIDDCSNTVVAMLQTALSSSGSRGALCSRYYHQDVSSASSDVVDHINGLSQEYIKLSTFVYHSFAGRNALIDSELIDQVINSTYLELVNKFKFETVDAAAFEAILATISKNFKGCLDNSKGFAANLIQSADDQVKVCVELNDVPRASRGIRAAQFRSFMPEFEVVLNNYEEYKWK